MKTIKDLFTFICCGILNLGLEYFFKKSWRMRFGTPVFFLSLLAGKFRPFEQSAGVSAFMEIFNRSKMQIVQTRQTLKPAHVQKA